MKLNIYGHDMISIGMLKIWGKFIIISPNNFQKCLEKGCFHN